MNMFLSSQGVPERLRQQFINLFAKPAKDVQLAYIVDAGDVYSEEEKEGWYYEAIADIDNTGISYEFIRLKDYADNQSALAECLNRLDGVYVGGGNDYYLRYQARLSGFDSFISSITNNSFIYSGYSAGSIAAGPTLKYLDLNGDPLMAPEKIEEGLGLIDTIVIPHWNQEVRHGYFEKLVTAYDYEGWKYITLRDDQAVQIIEGKIELLGE